MPASDAPAAAVDAAAITGGVRVDARGMRCPWPALRVGRALRGARRVLVIADDPIAPGELAALAAELGLAFAIVADAAGPAFLIGEPERA